MPDEEGEAVAVRPILDNSINLSYNDLEPLITETTYHAYPLPSLQIECM
jgi:hypothetical protein